MIDLVIGAKVTLVQGHVQGNRLSPVLIGLTIVMYTRVPTYLQVPQLMPHKILSKFCLFNESFRE